MRGASASAAGWGLSWGGPWRAWRVVGPPVPPEHAVDLALGVRATLRATGLAPPAGGERAPFAVVPLPWVGPRGADGRVLGVAVLPLGAEAAARLEQWAGGAQRARAPAGIVELVPLREEGELPLLERSSWSGPARVWVTATPVALERNPGDLRAAEAVARLRARAAAAALVAAACRREGLPAPISVDVDLAPWLGGARVAWAHGPFPRRASRGDPRRVLVHARIVFPAAVDGPLLLGAGRPLGLGLFRPLGR